MLSALGSIPVFELPGSAIDIYPVEHGRVVADGGDETESIGVEFGVRIRDIEARERVGGGGSGRWSVRGLWEDPEL